MRPRQRIVLDPATINREGVAARNRGGALGGDLDDASRSREVRVTSEICSRARHASLAAMPFLNASSSAADTVDLHQRRVAAALRGAVGADSSGASGGRHLRALASRARRSASVPEAEALLLRLFLLLGCLAGVDPVRPAAPSSTTAIDVMAVGWYLTFVL